MRLSGRRVHIAGSASAGGSHDAITYAHNVVRELTIGILHRGGGLTVGVGHEPAAVLDSDGHAPSIVFDWTVIESVGDFVSAGGSPTTSTGPLLACVVTSKTEDQIPDRRRALWEDLKARGAVRLEFLDPGWSSGAMRRYRQSRLGDVLVAISGGEGVEQLAQSYVQSGKPVIPLDIDLGSSSSDGGGGAARLYRRALKSPNEFVRFVDPSRGPLLFAQLDSAHGTRAPAQIAGSILVFLDELDSPLLFCVRLLNPSLPEFSAVEDYFRSVIDPLGRDLGFTVFETGRDPTEYAWMNEEIFDKLHYSAAVVVDVTGLRLNCFLELGYALGGQRRVIVTALEGTKPPFDSVMIPHHFWKTGIDNATRLSELKSWWRKYIDRPPIVRPRSVL